MAAFFYQAVDAHGRSRKGAIEAANPAMAREALRQQGLLPLSVEPTARRSLASRFGLVRPVDATRGGGDIGLKALALFSRQMLSLIESGIRADEALGVIARQAQRPKLAALCLSLRTSLLEGRSLAAALAEHPDVFSEFYRASIAAGEQSGRLAHVLARLADYVEGQARRRQSIGLALAYPILLAVLSLVIIVGMMTFILPDIVRVFVQRGAALPFLTRALIALSDALRHYGIALAMGLGLFWLAALRWARPAHRTIRLHGWLLRLPGLGGLLRQMAAAQFTATLAMLTESGVPLVDALHAAAKATPNRYMRVRIEEAARQVQGGKSLYAAMTQADILPLTIMAMIASGEASGDLGPALTRAATNQQRDAEAVTATAVGLAEPVMLLIMGAAVMMMVLAVLMPIMGLNSLAGR
jgi:general secretion pathway protein F